MAMWLQTEIVFSLNFTWLFVRLSWTESRQYCKKMGKRMLSLDQTELANKILRTVSVASGETSLFINIFTKLLCPSIYVVCM